MTDENIRTESFYVDDPTHLPAELVTLQNQYPGWTGSVQQQLVEADGRVRVVVRYTRTGGSNELNPLSGL